MTLTKARTRISRPKSFGVIGAQIGDEGKAEVENRLIKKLVSHLKWSEGNGDKRVVDMRYQGGGNAGHTVTTNGVSTKTHQIPIGIVTQGVYNLLGKGMFVNPRTLVTEITRLRSEGFEISPENLGVASDAHVTLDYHTKEDRAAFDRADHTSTGSGIKQTARDKYSRTGLNFQEFLDPNLMSNILKERQGMSEAESKRLVSSYREEREFLERFSVLENEVVNDSRNGFLFLEGAQGVMLDIDHGHYPGITSSHPSNPPYRPDVLLSVFKLYQSTVGDGDRATIGQLDADLEARLRDLWGERGTTTGRDRSLTWFDAVAGRYSVECTDPDYLAITCGDRMEALHKEGVKPRIIMGYRIGSKIHTKWHPDFHKRSTLYEATPVFEEFEPWEKFMEEGEGTPNAKKYLEVIQGLLGREIALVKYGADITKTKEYIDLLAA